MYRRRLMRHADIRTTMSSYDNGSSEWSEEMREIQGRIAGRVVQ